MGTFLSRQVILLAGMSLGAFLGLAETTTFLLAQDATTVQLPTFQYFSVNTSVLVPDGGGASLGGINRAASQSSTRGFGPLRNRGFGSTTASSTMSVHATVIDLEEMDRAVLAEAAARRGGAVDSSSSFEAPLISTKRETRAVGVARKSADPAIPSADLTSVQELRQQTQQATLARAAEAQEHFDFAQAAEAAGKWGVAKIHYQSVLRRDTAELAQQARQRLAAISQVATTAKR